MEQQPTLEELRHFFENATLPPPPFQLDTGTKIVVDLKEFVAVEFGIVDAASSQVVVRPALNRLYRLYELLNKQGE